MEDTTIPRVAESQERLIALLWGHIPVQLVYVMARLRLADWLEESSETVDELSARTGTQPDVLRRVVRGLASVGLIEFEQDDRLSLTEMGALLGSRRDGSLRDVALFRGGESFTAWSRFEDAVRTGRPAFEAAYDESFFGYMRSHPEAGAAFDRAMTQFSTQIIREALERYDFGAASKVLDIGGGRGHFVAAVLEAHPHLEGAVFDVPDVAEGAANPHLQQAHLSGRCAAIGGSFFEALPDGYDLLLLKWILHNWNDAGYRRLLAVCRAALPDNGRLLILEDLLPETVPSSGALHPTIALDLTMLVNFGEARERTLAEHERLLADGGFTIHQVVSLPSGISMLDCRLRGPASATVIAAKEE